MLFLLVFFNLSLLIVFILGFQCSVVLVSFNILSLIIRNLLIFNLFILFYFIVFSIGISINITFLFY